MAKQKIKVLFFIAGTVATDEENEAMNEFGAKHTVCVRNASMIGDNEAVEPFDIVAGAVPDRYAEVAKSKPAFKERERPKTPADSAPANSPVPPPQGGQEGAGEGEGAGKPEDKPQDAPAAPQGDAKPAEGAKKPKAPEAKPEAAKGWKPNA
jgi:hypothetical protein